jgi:GT2 family glycosyltransferase
MNVAVCVITFHRPAGLKRLLDGIAQLTFEKCSPNLRVVVVDNDPQASSRELCREIAPNFPWQLEYHVEPQRGIPFARNRSVAVVVNDVDFIIFIDDDEVPQPSWLDHLLHAQQTYNADAVSGPVIPYFDQPIPPWIEKGRFFERPRHQTGYLMFGASTNNTLVRSEVIKAMGKVFDERLALTGGSDWHFFRRVHQAGYKIIWADDAIVYEWIPRSRSNMGWLLQRSYRLGTTESFCEIDINPTFSTKLICAFKGIRRIIIGLLLIPLSLVQGRPKLVKTLRYIYHSTGMLSGATGKTYNEYQTIHTV